MKIPCPEHGAHFGDEIQGIIECPSVWIRWGLQSLPIENRLELAEWFVTIPSDKIFIETGWGVSVGISGEYIGYDRALANNAEYASMDDEQRRELQRVEIKKQYESAKEKPSLWKRLLKR
jgi:hypothetical protein